MNDLQQHYNRSHEIMRVIDETRDVEQRDRLIELQQHFLSARMSMSRALFDLMSIAEMYAVSDEFDDIKRNIRESIKSLSVEQLNMTTLISELSNTYSDEGNIEQ